MASHFENGSLSIRCVDSHGSLSSLDTLTPESALGRQSKASAIDTLSPYSDVGDRPHSSKSGIAASSFPSSGSLKEHADDDFGRQGPPPRGSTGELRRRKYCTPSLGSRWHSTLRLLPESTEISAVVEANLPEPSEPSVKPSRRRNDRFESEGESTSTSSACSREDDEVIIEGPLQQRTFWVLWRWRWCVLTKRELRIYRDEEEALEEPDDPLESYSVAECCSITPDFHSPAVINCICVATGEIFTSLRSGPGARWEELAAASLWLQSHGSVANAAPPTFKTSSRLSSGGHGMF